MMNEIFKEKKISFLSEIAMDDMASRQRFKVFLEASHTVRFIAKCMISRLRMPANIVWADILSFSPLIGLMA